MSLEQYAPEQLTQMSLIELAYEILLNKKQAMTFNELIEEITDLLNLSEEQVKQKIAQFYTDVNIDGRFICVGENRWGLRSWYPYDQIDEETTPTVKTKKKKKSKKAKAKAKPKPKAKTKVKDDDIEDVDALDDLDEDEVDFDDLDDYDSDDEDTDDEDTDDEDTDDLEEEELIAEDDFEIDDDDDEDE